MNLTRQLPHRAASLLAAVTVAFALSGCGRVLPTSPDAGLETARGGANTNSGVLLIPDGGGDSFIGGGSGPAPGAADGGGQDPLVPINPTGPSGGGPSGLPESYTRVANKLVKPNREVSVAGGRWSLAFHDG